MYNRDIQVKESQGRNADPLIIHDVAELNYAQKMQATETDEKILASGGELSSEIKDKLLQIEEEPVTKTEELLYGLRAIEGSVFHPAKFACCDTGIYQTMLSAWREFRFDKQIYYDIREIYKLADGGTTYIDCQGQHFYGENASDQKPGASERPLVLLVPGLTQESVQPAVKIIVEDLVENGFDVAVINYRGCSGAPLTSVNLSGPCSWKDIIEPMKYMHGKYIKNTQRKVFAIGFSMGANILANILGHISDGTHELAFDGAICVQAPNSVLNTMKFGINQSLNGFFNRHLGKSLKKQIMDHEDQMNDQCIKQTGKSLRDHFDNWSESETTLWQIDDKLSHTFFGYDNIEQYYDDSSCYHRIPMIQTPTLFLNSLDDPIISKKQIQYDLFKQNKNIALATTKFGGHLGYHSSFNNQRLWVMEPCIKFLNAMKQLQDISIEEL